MFELREMEGAKRNLLFALLSQLVSFLASLLMSFIVPKILGIEAYGYWQLFILYAGYTGMALFGASDGIVLRLGGSHLADLRRESIKGEFVLSILCQGLVLFVICSVLIAFQGGGGDRVFVLFATIVYGFINNAFSFIAYLFQSVNLTHVQSKAIMASRAILTSLLILFWVLHSEDYRFIIISFTVAQASALAYCLLYTHDLFVKVKSDYLAAARDLKSDIQCGIKVMVAYYADQLIVGITRMLFDARWGIEAFGVFSFSVTVINFFLTFVGQVSIVLLPMIRRMGNDDIKESYLLIRSTLITFLPLLYIGYFPLCMFLDWWVPDYGEAARYLALLLPICVYGCKMNLLFATYLKCFRLENWLLAVNLGAMVVSAFSSSACVYIFNSPICAALCMVVCIAFRSICAEHLLSQRMRLTWCFNAMLELVLSVLFICFSFFISSPFVVFIFLVIYWGLNRRAIWQAFGLIREHVVAN